jgi:hypothetical protein
MEKAAELGRDPQRIFAFVRLHGNRLEDLNILDVIEVVVTSGESRQTMTLKESRVCRVSREQVIARHHVIRGPQDSPVQRQDPQEAQQSARLLEVHFLYDGTMTLEVTQHLFGSDLFIFDDPGAQINEQGV